MPCGIFERNAYGKAGTLPTSTGNPIFQEVPGNKNYIVITDFIIT